jgi:hypothetical protein
MKGITALAAEQRQRTTGSHNDHKRTLLEQPREQAGKGKTIALQIKSDGCEENRSLGPFLCERNGDDNISLSPDANTVVPGVPVSSHQRHILIFSVISV